MGIEREMAAIKMDETPRWFLDWCAQQTGHTRSSMGNNGWWALYRLFINGHVSLEFIATQGKARIESLTRFPHASEGLRNEAALLSPDHPNQQGRFQFFNRLRTYRGAGEELAARGTSFRISFAHVTTRGMR